MQNDFVLSGAPLVVEGALRIIPKIAELLEVFRKENLPVFYMIRNYRVDGSDAEKVRKGLFRNGNGVLVPRTAGCEIVGGIRPIKRENEYIIVKRRWSAFFATKLNKLLRGRGVGTIVVTGCSLPNCIRTTIYDGVGLDYGVILIEDAVAGPSPTFKENVEDIKNIGVEVLTANELARRLVKSKQA
jgi:nicotinamidase-related amidase